MDMHAAEECVKGVGRHKQTDIREVATGAVTLAPVIWATTL